MPHDIAIVGATGAVGRELLGLLCARGIAQCRVRALASARSAGVALSCGDSSVVVQELGAGSFLGSSLVIFAASAEVSCAFVPAAIDAGALVIDNSSAFRLDTGVPLVIPEVNSDAINADLVGGKAHRLIANPNCTTILLLTAIEPLRRGFGVEAIDVATSQAVSGAGASGICELLDQSGAVLDGEAVTSGGVFAEPCAFNVFSHDSAVDPGSGVNGEERKIIDEVRKIWQDPAVRVTPTCLRVPVVRAHTEAIVVTLAAAATEQQVREALASGAGIEIVDDRAGNAFPTPLKASGRDAVFVGRIRPDPGQPLDRCGRSRRWCLLACGDQLRKGAALNAVQIAEVAGGVCIR